MKTSLLKITSAMSMAIMAGALTIGQVMAAGGGNTRTTPPANATATQSRDRVQLKTQDCVYACEPAQDRVQQQSRTQLQDPTLLQDRIQ